MNSLFEKISEGVKYQHRKEDLYWVGVFLWVTYTNLP